MSEATIAEASQSRIMDGGASRSDRPFYVIAAITMLFFTVVGFRNFYLYGKAFEGEITGSIYPLVIAHGLAMSAWVVSFLIQSLLISAGNRRFT